MLRDVTNEDHKNPESWKKSREEETTCHSGQYKKKPLDSFFAYVTSIES